MSSTLDYSTHSMGRVAALALLLACSWLGSALGDEAACFPLLGDGLHITTAYSDPANASAVPLARAAWNRVLAAGRVDSWQLGLTWASIEPIPGRVNVSYVVSPLELQGGKGVEGVAGWMVTRALLQLKHAG